MNCHIYVNDILHYNKYKIIENNIVSTIEWFIIDTDQFICPYVPNKYEWYVLLIIYKDGIQTQYNYNVLTGKLNSLV